MNNLSTDLKNRTIEMLINALDEIHKTDDYDEVIDRVADLCISLTGVFKEHLLIAKSRESLPS